MTPNSAPNNPSTANPATPPMILPQICKVSAPPGRPLLV
jgi:hypothetical protein